MNNRVGLAVMRLQPLHKGHCRVINRMIQDCQTAIICLGSAQKSREEHDPWTIEERMQMLRNVYADRIKIVPLNDLGASGPEQWTNYIFQKLTKLGMKEPTDYYTGSKADAKWYSHCFWDGNQEQTYSTDFSSKMRCVSGNRLLHIIDRDMNLILSATDIRTCLSLSEPEWQQWTPRVNYDIIINNYPEEFKVPKD